MNTEAQQQIARVARDKIRSHFGKPLYANDEQDSVLFIILSAIERATKNAIASESQRSEQQEWEVRKQVRGWMLFTKDGSDIVDFLWLDEKYPTQIANSHNAALTAERQRREQAEAWLEEKRNESAIFQQDCTKYYNRLLSALAAVEELVAIANSRYCGHCDMGHKEDQCTCGNYTKDVDLSLLHEHDAAVRKPLVDALEEILTKCQSYEAAIRVARNALSTVKKISKYYESDDALAKIKNES